MPWETSSLNHHDQRILSYNTLAELISQYILTPFSGSSQESCLESSAQLASNWQKVFKVSTFLLNQPHLMGFWKILFNGTEAATPPRNYDGEVSTIGGQSKILFSTDREIDLYELEELCDAVGWSRRPLRKVKKAIQYSFLVTTMWQQRGNSRRLIGFARATSDHAFNATIWDVVVHPDFQSQGLGKAMMRYMLKKLRSEDISNITLFADPHVVEFYQRMGFLPDPEGIKGMFWYPE